MSRLRVAQRCFWPTFSFDHSIFVEALRLHHEVEIVEDVAQADLVFESCFDPPRPRKTLRTRLQRKWDKWQGKKPPVISGKRIFFSGEPFSLPLGTYHGVISYNLHLKENHFRLPLWVNYCHLWKGVDWRHVADPEGSFTPAQLTQVHLTSPKKFACTIFGNPQHLRFKMAKDLGRFGEVDIFGKSVGRVIASKMEVMPDYRFNLCFENTILPGYVTEKAVQAKMAGCIPLYWGDPAYRVDFNPKSLVNVYEYDCDWDRIFSTVDFEEIRHTPLMNEAPCHLLGDLARFLDQVLAAPDSSRF